MKYVKLDGKIGPLAALALLDVWMQSDIRLHVDDVDHLMGIVFDALFEARDSRYRDTPAEG